MSPINVPVRPVSKPGVSDGLYPPRSEFASPKIQAHQIERMAVVYVRQSSPQQVLEHRESTARQYALVDRAEALGWPREEVLVIDEDQGLSGQSAEGRAGFQRLLVEVSLDHVGLILGLEMSRLARSCKDWHQLLELCAIFRTLLADQDGLYDPNDPNDRMLLGLKGTISEVELHTLKNRLHQGKLNKARRGELFSSVPMGYVRSPSGGVVFDPDEQVQTVVRLVFSKFEELGAASAVLKYLVEHGIDLGIRQHSGPDRGELTWRRPASSTLINMLHHPMYAGAYAYGRRRSDPRKASSGKYKRGKVLSQDEWDVLRRDELPAYITWDQYLANQRQLERNGTGMAALGAAREGNALLNGLLFCGHCGRRMVVSFRNRRVFRYACAQQNLMYGADRCQSLSGRVLDELVTAKILKVLESASVELSLQAAGDVERERSRLTKLWEQRRQRAQYEAERAFRQYNAAEPENRLVVRELERRWDHALRQQRELEADYERFLQEQPLPLSDHEREQIRALSSSIPTLWQIATTTATDRKTIVRHLLERVVVSVQESTEVVDTTLHWAGGFTSEHRLNRPVLSYEQLGDFDQLKARVECFYEEGHSPKAIADRVNSEGFHPPNRRTEFTGPLVRRFLQTYCQHRTRTYRIADLNQLAPHEWTLKDLAGELSVRINMLHGWLREGWVVGRQMAGRQSHWILWADDKELQRLRRLSQLTHADRPYPSELTTPTSRPQQK